MRARIFRPVVAGMLFVTGVMAAGSGCGHEHHRGPAERAGAKVDRAADKTGDVIEDAGRKVNRALPGD